MAATENSNEVGTTVEVYEEMREALESCLDFIMRLDRAFNPFMQNLLENAVAKANTTLSAPPRNCDVGSPEEQIERHRLYCIGLCTAQECGYDLEKHDTETCKECFAKWAQMRRVEK